MSGTLCTQPPKLPLGAGRDHTQTSLFLQHKGGDGESAKGKTCQPFPSGEASCSRTAARLGCWQHGPAGSSALLLLLFRGWGLLLSSVGAGHH